MLNRRFLLVACLLLAIPLLALGPLFACRQVLLSRPGVQQSGLCGWTPQGIECSPVHYHRDHRLGSFDLVATILVTWQAKPEISRGTLTGTLVAPKGEASGNPAGPRDLAVKVRDLQVRLAGPYGSALTLDHLKVDRQACWQSGTWSLRALQHQVGGLLSNGCLDLASKETHLANLSFEADQKVPGYPDNLSGTIDGLGVKFSPTLQVTSGQVAIRGVGAATDLQASLDQGVLAGSLRPVLFHPWLSLDPGQVTFRYQAGSLSLKAQMGSLEATRESLQVDAPCDQVGKALGLEDDFKGRVAFKLDWSGPNPDLKLKSTCQLACQSPRFKGLHSHLSYQAYHPDGVSRFSRTAGPDQPSWVPLESLPDHIEQWWVRMEDPGFWGHSGVLAVALEASLRQNLQEGRFARGGSTITMQLARNLWLARDKNLTRKGQEILLSWALEKCLTKPEILAWYLNAVEFGPDQYGIAQGSWYHYGVNPMVLEPLEGFYLATIMPNPKRARKGQDAMELAAQRARRFTVSGWLPEGTLEELGIQEEGASEQDAQESTDEP
jgi:hypothetical protein